MTDCSCEGFTEVVKGWLAGGSFFFFFFVFSAIAERKQETDRQTGRNTEWREFRSLSHLVSFLAFRFIRLRLLSSSQDLPLGKEEKKKSFRVPGSIGENMRLCSYKHTFLLVLTCISKPLTRCSWKRIRSERPYTHTHAQTHTQESVQTQTYTGAAITSDAHHLCFSSPASL